VSASSGGMTSAEPRETKSFTRSSASE
jgi:hypothetical protein